MDNRETFITERLAVRFTEPIVGELPFFVSFVLLNFGMDISSFFGVLCNLSFLSLWAYLCIVCLLGRSAVFKIILYALSFLAFSVELFSTLCLDLVICPKVLALIAETNPEETLGFFTTYADNPGFISTVAIVCVLVGFVLFCERNYGRWRGKVTFRPWASVCLGLLVCCGVYPTSVLARLFFTENTDELTIWYGHSQLSMLQANIAQSVWTLHLSSGETEAMVERNLNIDDPGISAPRDTMDLVLVIGESFVKRHSSLYGYPLRTNPNLEEEARSGRLVCFDSVCSVSNMTSAAVRNMLCTNSLADGEQWYQSIFAPILFKRAGYDVFYWNNQMERSGAVWTFSLNSLLYNAALVPLSYSACNDSIFGYDEDLVADFARNAPAASSPCVLTIFHLKGQHFNPKSRYPEEFAYFTADSIRREESWMTERIKRKISEYDNAARYNDFVLKRIMSLYEDKNAVMVYLSDHGDEVFDYRPKNARPRLAKGMEREFEAYQMAVPFMVWASDSYRARHPETWARVGAASHRRFTSDCLPHLLFSLGDVATVEYDARHDILSDAYEFAPVDFWANVQ